jgi:hypothetical protein
VPFATSDRTSVLMMELYITLRMLIDNFADIEKCRFCMRHQKSCFGRFVYEKFTLVRQAEIYYGLGRKNEFPMGFENTTPSYSHGLKDK